jgi:hypothetical protein
MKGPWELNCPTLTHWVVVEVVEHVHVAPVLRAIHRHDAFREVHDEEERGLVGGQAAVFEKALVLVEVGVLTHCIGNCLVE